MVLVSVVVFGNLSPEAAVAWLSVESKLSLDLVECLSPGVPYALPGLIGDHGEIQMSKVVEMSYGMQD